MVAVEEMVYWWVVHEEVDFGWVLVVAVEEMNFGRLYEELDFGWMIPVVVCGSHCLVEPSLVEVVLHLGVQVLYRLHYCHRVLPSLADSGSSHQCWKDMDLNPNTQPIGLVHCYRRR